MSGCWLQWVLCLLRSPLRIWVMLDIDFINGFDIKVEEYIEIGEILEVCT